MSHDTGAVLVTGACGNLGRAAAAASAGRKLALLDRQQAILTSTFGPDSAECVTLACDLLDSHAVTAAVKRATRQLGTIRVLCNVAGGFRMGEPVHETSDTTWEFLMNLNLRSILHTARAVVPGMLAAGGGTIVNVGAAAGALGGARMGAYAASKSGVIRLTESMAAELREGGINVNCVLPTILDTPENRNQMPHADPSRWVKPSEVAGVIAFLASSTARSIHGACIPVAGLS